MAHSKKQNYLHGAAILTIGVAVTKILGFIYKIPLGNILGDEGMAHFNVAYNIYTFLLTLSTAGFPVVLSKMIAEANVLNRPMQAKRIFKVAFTAFLVLGSIASLLMFLFPAELAGGMDDIEAAQSIFALSPAVILVCILSAYRGYIQGYSNMTPTSMSQVIEVAVKVLFGLVLALLFSQSGRGLPEVSAAAIVGVPIGTLFACVYIFIVKKRMDREEEPLIKKAVDEQPPDGAGKILSQLLKIGIPIALGSSISSIITLLDTKLTMNRLQAAAGFSFGETKILYGVYTKGLPLFNLPAAFITPLTISVVPAIAAFVASKKHAEARNVTESSLRISTIMAIPMAVGISVLSEPIFNVLYRQSAPEGPALLAVLGIASYFVCMSLVMIALLQAYGAEQLPIIPMLVGGGVKIAVNWVLVSNPEINIYGSPIGTICCYAVMCVMTYIFLQSRLKEKLSLNNIILRPLIASAAMGAAAYALYGLASRVFLGDGDLSRMEMAIAMFGAIVVAAAIYLILIISTKAITAEDMKLIPKGEKIAALLRIK